MPLRVEADARTGDEPTRVIESPGPADAHATRVLAPSSDLLAAIRVDLVAGRKEMNPVAFGEADAFRVRRIIVAVTLVLVGCAGGLLAALPSRDSKPPVVSPRPEASAPNLKVAGPQGP
jgi:hypothetical protein